MAKEILRIENMAVSFTQYTKGLHQTQIEVVSDLCLTVDAGEILAIVGASGSGKSLLAHHILGILPRNAQVRGEMFFQGEVLDQRRKEALRGQEIALIPQSVNCLNPLRKVGGQIGRRGELQDAARRQILRRFGLDEGVVNLYPHQLSGGMARRVLVASAVIGGAQLIVADEPTPGLHPEVAAETLAYLREQADKGTAILLITHDITAALAVADRVAVFFAGTTVEQANRLDFAGRGERLRHPYTQALWRALPQNEFLAAPVRQPHVSRRSQGCLFQAMCSKATPLCAREAPALRCVQEGKVRCHHVA